MMDAFQVISLILSIKYLAFRVSTQRAAFLLYESVS